MSLIANYIAAFKTCYPDKEVVVKPRRHRGELRFRVIVNQDPGDILLTEDDMAEATRNFKRGK